MSDFAVEVVRIEDPVENHPDADRLSVIKIGGYLCISGKLEDGSHRYKQGDLVAYVPEGAVLPEWLMKRDGYWDTVKDKPAFKKVKAKKLRGIFSQGLLIAVETEEGNCSWMEGMTSPFLVKEGDNVAADLEITKYEPPIPGHMAGQMGNLYGITKKYDFESIQKQTKLFTEGELVSVTEKLHGTNIQIGYVPDLDANDGEYLGFYVTSKGLGKNGYNLKINEANAHNIYVREFLRLAKNGLTDRMIALSERHNGEPIRLYGELFGKGIQDLTYGVEPQVMFFDIQIGDEWLEPLAFNYVCDEQLQIIRVPVLFYGPFDMAYLETLRDGRDNITGMHMREGIVIKAADGDRKIVKWVSPDYLLRANATEFN